MSFIDLSRALFSVLFASLCGDSGLAKTFTTETPRLSQGSTEILNRTLLILASSRPIPTLFVLTFVAIQDT